jgi:hypothetical protein
MAVTDSPRLVRASISSSERSGGPSWYPLTRIRSDELLMVLSTIVTFSPSPGQKYSAARRISPRVADSPIRGIRRAGAVSESIDKTLQLHAALATHESVELVDDYVVEAIYKGRDSRAPVVEERLEGLWRYQNAAGPTLRRRLLSTGGHDSVARHDWYF